MKVVKQKSKKEDTYNPSAKETEIINDYREKLKFATAWQDDIYTKLMRYYFLYRGLQEEEEYPWRNNICLPVPFSIIETLTPRIVLNQAKVSLIGMTDEAKEHVEQSKAILDYDYFNQDFQLELVDWFKRNFIYGNSILKVMFKKTYRPTPTKKLLSKVKRFFRRKADRREEQCVTIQSLEPFHFRIDDPQTSYIRDARWVLNDIYLTEQEIKDDREGIYQNTKYVKAQEIKDDFASAKWKIFGLGNKKRGRILAEGITSVGSSQSFQRQKLVKVTELYIKSSKEYPLGRLIVIANDEIVLRDDINPYWYIDGEFPFIEIKDHPVPGEFYGIGEIEAIESLIYEKNDIRNRRLNSSQQSADEMWWINPESDIDENELVWRPGGIVNGRQGEDFGVIARGQPFVTMSNEEKLVDIDISSTVGISDYSKGLGQKYETATGMLALINEANQRFALKIKLIGEMGLVRLCKMILQMEQFEASGTRIGRILGTKGEEFINVPADEISSDYNFKVSIDPNPILNKTLDIETLNKVAQTMSVAPEGKAFQLIQREIIKRLDILPEEKIDTLLGEEKTKMMGGTLPRRIMLRESGSPTKALAEVQGGMRTAEEAQPTQPAVVSPTLVGQIPKRVAKR